jgi:four helix bundle protein
VSRDFRKIKAWKLADDLAVMVYQVTKNFPPSELYGLVTQLRRAVTSVPANIAEGASRAFRKEYLQFLYIARGSLAETEYFLHLSQRLGYISSADYEVLGSARSQAASTLQGLIRAVKSERER